MTWLSRLLAALTPDVVRTLAKEMRKPKRLPEPSMPLSHQDSEIQAKASREAGKFPNCCPFWRSAGFHGEDCYDQGREDCTPLKRGMPPSPTSPRAIRPPPLPPPRRKR